MTVGNATTSLMDIAHLITSPQNQEQAKAAAQTVTTGGKDLWFSFLGINWSQPTWDLVILVLFIVVVLIYGFTVGRQRVVSLLVSTYMALAVATNLPYMAQLTAMLHGQIASTFQVSSFLVVFIVLFLLLSRSNLLEAGGGGSLWQGVLFSILHIGLLISIVLSFMPESFVGTLSDFTKIVFLSDFGRFCWIALPIIALVFVKGRASRFNMY